MIENLVSKAYDGFKLQRQMAEIGWHSSDLSASSAARIAGQYDYPYFAKGDAT